MSFAVFQKKATGKPFRLTAAGQGCRFPSVQIKYAHSESAKQSGRAVVSLPDQTSFLRPVNATDHIEKFFGKNIPGRIQFQQFSGQASERNARCSKLFFFKRKGTPQNFQQCLVAIQTQAAGSLKVRSCFNGIAERYLIQPFFMIEQRKEDGTFAPLSGNLI